MYEKEEQYRLLKLVAEKDQNAREELIKNNLGLVKSIAGKFVGFGYEWEDLLQVGSIGLLKAIDRFDISYGVMFSTYAMPLILGEIKRYVRDDGRIKMSREVKNGIIRLKAVRDKLSKEKSRSPKLTEIAKAMEIEVEELLNIMEAEHSLNSMSSLDDPDGYEWEECDNSISCGEEKQVDSIVLKEIIENLPCRERQIIILRYYKDMTQSEIAEILGISQVHVSRLEKKTLAKIGEAFSQDKQSVYRKV